MISISDENSAVPNDAIYLNYLELGGKVTRERFEKLISVFFALTADTYTGGEIPDHYKIEAELLDLNIRIVAFGYWQRFLKRVGCDPKDADRIFDAADAYGGYS